TSTSTSTSTSTGSNSTTSGSSSLPSGAVLIDDMQSGYSETGTGWFGENWFSNDYNHESRLGLANGTSTATWQLTGLAAGTYTVDASWVGYHNDATSAPYYIYDGDTLVATIRVDQTVAASGLTIGVTSFQTLATVNITSGTLRIVLGSDNANGYYIEADA